MNVEQAKIHCLSFPGVTRKTSGPPSSILKYSVGDKQFAYFKTSEPEKWRFSIRVTTDRFLELTDQYGIKPARYMGRFHWVTIIDIALIDEEYLLVLIEWSYNRALSSLTKKVQTGIFG